MFNLACVSLIFSFCSYKMFEIIVYTVYTMCTGVWCMKNLNTFQKLILLFNFFW